ncbi:MAG TPA: GNAT family N-acetyltransferase [Nocardioidaceae bacterium]|nr:GNAT family N-acetyltransferase [Nocardioidaceae bacterium]
MTGDAARFRELVFPYLQHDPVLHTVLLTSVESRTGADVVDEDPPTFASVHGDGGAVVAAAMHTRSHGIFLGGLQREYAGAVADAFAATSPDAATLEALTSTASVFVQRWQTLLGVGVSKAGGTRLHLLRELHGAAAAGGPRRGTEADVDLLTAWVDAFGRELGMAGGISSAAVRGWTKTRRVWLWEDDGRPVSLAAHQLPCHGVTRIGPVYTPPEQRGHGYASALTAHISAVQRGHGSQVCLFTELDNPTSNKIYAAIGFEPVADFARYSFR